MNFGSAFVSIDLVDPGLSITPTIPPTQPSRRDVPDDTAAILSFPSPPETGSFADISVIGPLAELKYLTRNDEVRLFRDPKLQ